MTVIVGQEKPSLEDVLAHHGVKGMHWGVRRHFDDASSTHKARSAVRKDTRQLKKVSGVHRNSQNKAAKEIRQTIKTKEQNDPKYAEAIARRDKLASSFILNTLKSNAGFKLASLTGAALLGPAIPTRVHKGNAFKVSADKGERYIKTKPPMMKARKNSNGVYAVTNI